MSFGGGTPPSPSPRTEDARRASVAPGDDGIGQADADQVDATRCCTPAAHAHTRSSAVRAARRHRELKRGLFIGTGGRAGALRRRVVREERLPRDEAASGCEPYPVLSGSSGVADQPIRRVGQRFGGGDANARCGSGAAALSRKVRVRGKATTGQWIWEGESETYELGVTQRSRSRAAAAAEPATSAQRGDEPDAGDHTSCRHLSAPSLYNFLEVGRRV